MNSSHHFNNKTETLPKWLLTILAGFTLLYVLYVFKGYGIQEGTSYSGHSFLVRCLIFGTANSLVYYLFEFHLIRYYRVNSNGKKMLWLLAELLVGGSVTYLLFNYFWNWTEWYWSSYSLLMMEYMLVMIIPFAIVLLISHFRARDISDDPTYLKFQSQNGKDELSIVYSNFLFLKSTGNYVEVHYRSAHGQKTHLIRNSLKAIEEQFDNYPYLTRCHRSYLVNPTNVDRKVKSKGKIELYLGESQVPVTPSYESSFAL